MDPPVGWKAQSTFYSICHADMIEESKSHHPTKWEDKNLSFLFWKSEKGANCIHHLHIIRKLEARDFTSVALHAEGVLKGIRETDLSFYLKWLQFGVWGDKQLWTPIMMSFRRYFVLPIWRYGNGFWHVRWSIREYQEKRPESMIPWIYGSVVQQIHASVVPRIHGSVVPWIHDSIVLDSWFRRTMETWCSIYM